MKTNLYITCIFILIFRAYLYSVHTLPCAGDEGRENTAAISMHTGFLYGSIGEYVYSGSREVSELNWDIKPLLYTGPAFSINYNNLIFSLGYWISLNPDAGIITDTDRDESGAISRVSRHDCVITPSKFFDARAGYSLSFAERQRLGLYLGYNFKQIKLEAKEGYVLNPSTGERYSADGLFIEYEQSYHIPYIAASWQFNFIRNLSVYATLIFSPLVFCNATDNHVTREIEFHDHIEFGRYYALYAGTGWKIGSACTLDLSGGYSEVLKTRGDTYYVNTRTGENSGTYKNAAGISLQTWELRLSASCSIKPR